MAVDTLVEHTEPIGENNGELRNDEHTDHPISVTTRGTIVETTLDSEREKCDDIDRIYVT